ncbi:MAG: hypothetical protein MI976_11455 [Pseudomonadales bacterium]|nr:hypothetical protein [Pseudomonadales bacterium]
MGDNFKEISSSKGNINIATRGSNISLGDAAQKESNASIPENEKPCSSTDSWYKRPFGTVFLGVVIIILGALCTWIVNKFTSIGL